jgi:hypothetical protein
MASYTAQQLNGVGTPTEELPGGVLKLFTLTNPSSGSAYFTVETVSNTTGSYQGQPTNALGIYAGYTGSISASTLITSSYISSIVCPSGVNAYTFAPTATVAVSSSMLRATGGISLVIS